MNEKVLQLEKGINVIKEENEQSKIEKNEQYKIAIEKLR